MSDLKVFATAGVSSSATEVEPFDFQGFFLANPEHHQILLDLADRFLAATVKFWGRTDEAAVNQAFVDLQAFIQLSTLVFRDFYDITPAMLGDREIQCGYKDAFNRAVYQRLQGTDLLRYSHGPAVDVVARILDDEYSDPLSTIELTYAKQYYQNGYSSDAGFSEMEKLVTGASPGIALTAAGLAASLMTGPLGFFGTAVAVVGGSYGVATGGMSYLEASERVDSAVQNNDPGARDLAQVDRYAAGTKVVVSAVTVAVPAVRYARGVEPVPGARPIRVSSAGSQPITSSSRPVRTSAARPTTARPSSGSSPGFVASQPTSSSSGGGVQTSSSQSAWVGTANASGSAAQAAKPLATQLTSTASPAVAPTQALSTTPSVSVAAVASAPAAPLPAPAPSSDYGNQNPQQLPGFDPDQVMDMPTAVQSLIMEFPALIAIILEAPSGEETTDQPIGDRSVVTRRDREREIGNDPEIVSLAIRIQELRAQGNIAEAMRLAKDFEDRVMAAIARAQHSEGMQLSGLTYVDTQALKPGFLAALTADGLFPDEEQIRSLVAQAGGELAERFEESPIFSFANIYRWAGNWSGLSGAAKADIRTRHDALLPRLLDDVWYRPRHDNLVIQRAMENAAALRSLGVTLPRTSGTASPRPFYESLVAAGARALGISATTMERILVRHLTRDLQLLGFNPLSSASYLKDLISFYTDENAGDSVGPRMFSTDILAIRDEIATQLEADPTNQTLRADHDQLDDWLDEHPETEGGRRANPVPEDVEAEIDRGRTQRWQREYLASRGVDPDSELNLAAAVKREQAAEAQEFRGFLDQITARNRTATATWMTVPMPLTGAGELRVAFDEPAFVVAARRLATEYRVPEGGRGLNSRPGLPIVPAQIGTASAPALDLSRVELLTPAQLLQAAGWLIVIQEAAVATGTPIAHGYPVNQICQRLRALYQDGTPAQSAATNIYWTVAVWLERSRDAAVRLGLLSPLDVDTVISEHGSPLMARMHDVAGLPEAEYPDLMRVLGLPQMVAADWYAAVAVVSPNLRTALANSGLSLDQQRLVVRSLMANSMIYFGVVEADYRTLGHTWNVTRANFLREVFNNLAVVMNLLSESSISPAQRQAYLERWVVRGGESFVVFLERNMREFTLLPILLDAEGLPAESWASFDRTIMLLGAQHRPDQLLRMGFRRRGWETRGSLIGMEDMNDTPVGEARRRAIGFQDDAQTLQLWSLFEMVYSVYSSGNSQLYQAERSQVEALLTGNSHNRNDQNNQISALLLARAAEAPLAQAERQVFAGLFADLAQTMSNPEAYSAAVTVAFARPLPAGYVPMSPTEWVSVVNAVQTVGGRGDLASNTLYGGELLQSALSNLTVVDNFLANQGIGPAQRAAMILRMVREYRFPQAEINGLSAGFDQQRLLQGVDFGTASMLAGAAQQANRGIRADIERLSTVFYPFQNVQAAWAATRMSGQTPGTETFIELFFANLNQLNGQFLSSGTEPAQ